MAARLCAATISSSVKEFRTEAFVLDAKGIEHERFLVHQRLVEVPSFELRSLRKNKL